MLQTIKNFFIGGLEQLYFLMAKPFIYLFSLFNNLSFYKKCCLLILSGILLYVPYIDEVNTCHDDQYTLLLCRYSIVDLIKTIALEDGHPPLSYLYAKLWVAIFNNHEYDVVAMHIATLFCFFLTALLGVFPLKRLVGEKTALIWLCLLFLMPATYKLANNMRMYPLAMFLITAIFIYGMLLIHRPQKSDWFFFAIFTLLALYTHYYCAILCSVIWLIVLIEILRSKKYKRLIPFFISGSVIAMLFAPWLYAFYTQYQNMKDVWYVDMQGAYNAFSGMFFYYDGPGGFLCFCVFFGSLCQILVLEYLLSAKNDKIKHNTTKYAFIVFWSIYVIAFVLSVLLRPTISIRFLVITPAVFYVGLAVALIYNKKYRLLFTALLLVIFVKGYKDMYGYAHNTTLREMKTYIEKQIPKNSLVLYGSTNAEFILMLYRPDLDLYFTPEFSYLCLLQDQIKKEKLKDLKEYDAIYTLLMSPYNGKCDNSFFTSYGNYCLHHLTEKEALNEIKRTEMYRYHCLNKTLFDNASIDIK